MLKNIGMKELKLKIKNLLKDKYFWILFLIYFFIILNLSTFNHSSDHATWLRWMGYIQDGGFLNLFNYREVNYPPLFLYVMYFWAKILPNAKEVADHFYVIKGFVFLFDIGSIYLVIKLLRQFKFKEDLVFFILFNIAFLVNTLLWGQVDSIHTFFCLASIYAAIRKWSLFSILLFVLGLNTKIQSIIFAPIIFLLLTPQFWKKPDKFFFALLSAIVLQVIILLPFIYTGKLQSVLNIITGSVGFFPYISMNAYNFWLLVLGPGRAWNLDSSTFIFFSYKTWGIILFLISSLGALLPVIRLIWPKLKEKVWQFSQTEVSVIMLSAGLCAFNFFFFTTQMHERYLYPAIIFFAIYALINKKYLIYAMISIGYFLNVERFMMYFTIDHNFGLFSSRPVAFLLLIVWGMAYYYLYQMYFASIVKRVRFW